MVLMHFTGIAIRDADHKIISFHFMISIQSYGNINYIYLSFMVIISNLGHMH